MQNFILFEPENLAPFGPLTLLQSVSELRWGIYSNMERTVKMYPDAALGLWVRPIMQADHQFRFPDIEINQESPTNTIFLNAAVPAWHYPEALSILSDMETGRVMKADIIIAAKTIGTKKFSSLFHKDFSSLTPVKCDEHACNHLPNWIWDYLDEINTAIELDLTLWEQDNIYLTKLPSDISSLDDRHIYIHNTAQLGKYVHLDASQGAIVIDKDCKISPFSSLIGPLYIGKRTLLKPGTAIRHSVIGEVCNLGGEIKGSIIHPYSNKSHDGFLGDSILGSWINLGAGTITSNLKNNYQPIRVSWDGNNFDTSRQFLGSIIGDHTKTAIGVRLNTGTLIGAFCNVFQADFPPRAIPSFSWGNGTYDLDKAIQTAQRVFRRRSFVISKTQEDLMRSLATDITPFIHF